MTLGPQEQEHGPPTHLGWASYTQCDGNYTKRTFLYLSSSSLSLLPP